VRGSGVATGGWTKEGGEEEGRGGGLAGRRGGHTPSPPSLSLCPTPTHLSPLSTLQPNQVADRAQLESVLAQAEGAYAKILESAQALVAVLRTEAGGRRAAH
jgi:hypothetical protein